MLTPTKTIRFTVAGLTGRDFWAELLLPRPMFRRYLARRLRGSIWKGFDAEACALVFTYQGEAWRILPDGSLERPAPELAGNGVML